MILCSKSDYTIITLCDVFNVSAINWNLRLFHKLLKLKEIHRREKPNLPFSGWRNSAKAAKLTSSLPLVPAYCLQSRIRTLLIHRTYFLLIAHFFLEIILKEWTITNKLHILEILKDYLKTKIQTYHKSDLNLIDQKM